MADSRGFVLRFSFDIFERSLQTAMIINGEEISVISHEGLLSINIPDGAKPQSLEAKFEGKEYLIGLSIQVRPKIHVRWSSLLN